MGYMYRNGVYPKNSAMFGVRSAAKRLHAKLHNLRLDALEISDYNKRYFGDQLVSDDILRGHLTKYGYILEWALSGIEKSIENLVLIDYGGGHGMLSLLAKETGIGTVIHNDIYPVSCQDANKIGSALGLQADYYVPGDIDAILDYCKIHGVSCDVVANYDVIEHIYDIDDFLGKLHRLSDGAMSIFLASAANDINPRIRRILQRQHNKFEFQDRPVKYGRKPIDTTRAILDVRKDIIKSHSSSLSHHEIDNLAAVTRGMIKADIEAAVDQYLRTKIYPSKIKHPTNTCDPITGSWIEHLMDPWELASQLSRTGYSVQVKCGYYDYAGSFFTRSLKSVMNAAISSTGSFGLRLAPYYALFAIK